VGSRIRELERWHGCECSTQVEWRLTAGRAERLLNKKHRMNRHKRIAPIAAPQSGASLLLCHIMIWHFHVQH